MSAGLVYLLSIVFPLLVAFLGMYLQVRYRDRKRAAMANAQEETKAESHSSEAKKKSP